MWRRFPRDCKNVRGTVLQLTNYHHAVIKINVTEFHYFFFLPTCPLSECIHGWCICKMSLSSPVTSCCTTFFEAFCMCSINVICITVSLNFFRHWTTLFYRTKYVLLNNRCHIQLVQPHQDEEVRKGSLATTDDREHRRSHFGQGERVYKGQQDIGKCCSQSHYICIAV